SPRIPVNIIKAKKLIATGKPFPIPLVQGLTCGALSIKKPKTSRYPSLKGTDPKFRRNHRHALHGTMKALKELKEGKRDTA
ncbi:60S ribosomal protein, partial [Lachnellula hyalina]